MKTVADTPRCYIVILYVVVNVLWTGIVPNAAGQDLKYDPFATLGQLNKYLNFPINRPQLDTCFKDNDDHCIKLYADQRRAVAHIFSNGRSEALRQTLDAVDKRCRKQPLTSRSLEVQRDSCRGAATMFYFFGRNEEDRSIVSFLKKLDPDTLANMFINNKVYTGDWVTNRPNKSRWLSFIDSLVVLDSDPPGRSGYKNIFLHPPPEHTGIMLLDTELKLSPEENSHLKSLDY